MLSESSFRQHPPMPRRARIALPGVPLHVIQRGNNRQACFFADDDYRFYLAQLSQCIEK
jgi:putative transposase